MWTKTGFRRTPPSLHQTKNREEGDHEIPNSSSDPFFPVYGEFPTITKKNSERTEETVTEDDPTVGCGRKSTPSIDSIYFPGPTPWKGLDSVCKTDLYTHYGGPIYLYRYLRNDEDSISPPQRKGRVTFIRVESLKEPTILRCLPCQSLKTTI